MSLIALIPTDPDPRPSSNRIYASNAGDCTRALWYRVHGYQPIPMRADVSGPLGVLAFGHAIESFVADYLVALQIGFRRSTLDDKRHLEPIGTVWPDGIWARENHADIPVDIKSLSDYAFQRAAAGDISAKYRAQLEAEARAWQVPMALLVGYSKATSELCEVPVYRDEEHWARVCASVTAARADAQPERPDECQQLDKDGALRFPCSYCGYRDECWGELEETKPDWRGKTKLRPKK